MSSRQMRRSFAAPLVVTLALAPACTTVDHRTAPPPNPPPPAGDTADHRAPPPAGGSADHRAPEPAPPPAGGTTWTVFQKPDGTCAAGVAVTCQPGASATCNPPAPRPYACPEGITADRPLHIHQDAAGADCFLLPAPPQCPAGVMCNPPPPRKVGCPS